MATYSAVIRKNERKKDGTWNVKIRVTHNRESKYIPTPLYVDSSQITRGFKIKDANVLDKAEKQVLHYRDVTNRLGFVVDGITIDHLIKILKDSDSSQDFFEFMRLFIARERATGHEKTADAHTTAMNSLYVYNKRRPLSFGELTSNYMLGYYDYLMERVKTTTVRGYLSCLKTMYHAALKELNDDDIGVIVVRNGVFGKIKMPPANDTERKPLTIKQMQAVIDVPYTDAFLFDFAKDMFVLTFVMFGINSRDLFFAKKSQVKNGIFHFNRKKVSRMGKAVDMDIKINKIAKIILDKYSGDPEYLIDFMGHSRRTNICRYIHNAFIEAGLEDMPVGRDTTYEGSRVGHYKGNYVFYAARHTMATIMLNKCKVNILLLHQMLNHVAPREFQTTDVYAHGDCEELWKKNDKMLSMFDWSFYEKQKRR